MGKPTLSVMIEYSSDLSEGRELGELKHLSTRRKRDLLGIPSVAASESGEAQTPTLSWGVSDSAYLFFFYIKTFWNGRP